MIVGDSLSLDTNLEMSVCHHVLPNFPLHGSVVQTSKLGAHYFDPQTAKQTQVYVAHMHASYMMSLCVHFVLGLSD